MPVYEYRCNECGKLSEILVGISPGSDILKCNYCGSSDLEMILSEKVIERVFNPRYLGEMENSQACAEVTGPCGDTVKIFLRIQDNKIIDARFITDGCVTTVAASSMACELAIGKSIKEAFKISQEVILENLGGLPEESIHCALLASNTLKAALTDCLTSEKEPWRRLYKR